MYTLPLKKEFHNFWANNESNNVSTDAVTIKQTTATNSNSSIADMVEKASKSIVGVVNMQKQPQGQGYLFPNSNNANTNSSNVVESGSGTGVIFKVDGNVRIYCNQ